MILACASFMSSTLTLPVRLFAHIAGPLFKNQKVRTFLLERTQPFFKQQIASARKAQLCLSNGQNKPTFWLHVASAGELEQVIPIMRELERSLSVCFFVTYFSPSTQPFLKHCPGLIGCVSLPAESSDSYSEIIETLNIKRILLVRYDFWPTLIHTAQKQKIPIAVLAATIAKARSPLPAVIQQRIRLFWFKKADLLFLIAQRDKDALLQMGVSPHQLIVSGDAKWARAKERAQGHRHEAETTPLQKSIALLRADNVHGERKIVVFGSPHAEELTIAKQCVAHFDRSCVFIIAPAELNERHLSDIESELSGPEVTALRLSRLATLSDGAWLQAARKHIVLILDSFGQLTDAYGLADCAVVGGGFDGQLHNVLEPAAYPILTLFGRLATRAPEAQILLNHNAALGFVKPNDLFDFLKRWSSLEVEGGGNESTCPDFDRTLECARELFGSLPDTSEVVCRAIAQKDKLEFT